MLTLSNKCISRDGTDVFVVAEIGQNHQGSLELAKQMILQAKLAGCDAVKFQKSCLQAKFTETALNRHYDNSNSWGTTYGDHKAYLEFSIEQLKELQCFAKKEDIIFGVSAMDEVSLIQLYRLNVDFIKIGSGDANNIPLLHRASRLCCPLIISTGMQSMQSIRLFTDIICGKNNKGNMALMHCISSYPTAVENCALEHIKLLREQFPELVVGYSGHELGIEVSTAAVCLGARIIERHFTLNKQFKGTDHQCSLEPQEMIAMIDNFHKLKFLLEEANNSEKNGEVGRWVMQKILGESGMERIQSALLPVEARSGPFLCEIPCKLKLGKSLVASKDLKQGAVLRRKDLEVKVSEPQGISAEHYNCVIGSILNVDISNDMPIIWSAIEQNL